jgi:hypothetical protein
VVAIGDRIGHGIGHGQLLVAMFVVRRSRAAIRPLGPRILA